jgi:hypothetical protein
VNSNGFYQVFSFDIMESIADMSRSFEIRSLVSRVIINLDIVKGSRSDAFKGQENSSRNIEVLGNNIEFLFIYLIY